MFWKIAQCHVLGLISCNVYNYLFQCCNRCRQLLCSYHLTLQLLKKNLAMNLAYKQEEV